MKKWIYLAGFLIPLNLFSNNASACELMDGVITPPEYKELETKALDLLSSINPEDATYKALNNAHECLICALAMRDPASESSQISVRQAASTLADLIDRTDAEEDRADAEEGSFSSR